MLRSFKQKIRRSRMAFDGICEVSGYETASFGAESGMWTLCPSALDSQSVIYSFGVGDEITFDLALIERLGAKVHAFDPTPRSVEWVKNQNVPKEFCFHEFGLAAYDGSIKFYPPKKRTSSHFTPVKRFHSAGETECVECPVHRLSTVMNDLGHDHVDLLKIDIEGGEYDVIDDFLGEGIRVGQLLMEFHHCYSTIPYSRTRDAISRLKDAGFRITHISARTYEISFIHPG